MPALLFGSISTIADTSELQRAAFNRAFEAHGLDWQWDREEYQRLLESSGGEQRIADYARAAGQAADPRAVHRTKSELFQQSLRESPLSPRPGVAESVREAKEQGFKVALVTTTSAENVASLIQALDPSLDFDLIVDRSDVEQPKPHAASYRFALQGLGEPADACVAVEDNLGGVTAAQAAGVTCVAFPNVNTAGHDFGAAARRVETIDFSELRRSVPNA